MTIAFNVNDDILYEIAWSDEHNLEDVDYDILMGTTNNETYSCKLPLAAEKKNFRVAVEQNLNETALLSSFSDKFPCIYKIEGYWTYELCHWKYVRQFRSEVVLAKSPQVIKEFYLGFFTASQNSIIHDDVDDTKAKSIRINGREFIFYEVVYNNGSVCDLTGGNRVSHVLYICVEESNGELFQISEIESCVYQLIVFTKELCKSPKYNIKKVFKNEIKCRPHNANTPTKPMDLDRFEKEKQNLAEDSSTGLDTLLGILNFKGLKVEKVKQKGATVYRIRTVDTLEDDETDLNEDLELQEPDENKLKELMFPGITSRVNTPVDELQRARSRELESFLKMETCLTGGVGWWVYEICYGARIIQYHQYPETGEKIEILLGVWNEENHLTWIKKNPQLKPISDATKRQKFSQYYGNGDFCEKIDARRSVILTIRCEPSVKTTIQLTYSEPKDCQYSISLESALFCNVVKQADDNGILPQDVHIY